MLFEVRQMGTSSTLVTGIGGDGALTTAATTSEDVEATRQNSCFRGRTRRGWVSMMSEEGLPFLLPVVPCPDLPWTLQDQDVVVDPTFAAT